MYKVIIDGEEIIVTDQDLQKMNVVHSQNAYNVLHTHKSYRVEMETCNGIPKKGQISVNSIRLDYQIKSQYADLINSMGLSGQETIKITDISAPMPGLILDIMVQPGDEIVEGDSILIFEAMKMENIIKAEGSGIIKSIEKQIGDTVEKGQIIIQLEEE